MRISQQGQTVSRWRVLIVAAMLALVACTPASDAPGSSSPAHGPSDDEESASSSVSPGGQASSVETGAASSEDEASSAAQGTGSPTEAQAASTGSSSGGEGIPLSQAIAALEVAAETQAGYDRDLFDHWSDVDGDCLDTRDEVLKSESLSPTSGESCDVSGGEWYSYYDGRTWTSDDDLDIDHLVPLGEIWDSGARNWAPATRQAYANDLGDERTLVAVTDNVNQAKSDQDVAEWLPQMQVCRYASEWVAVKTRWQVSIDKVEQVALVSLASQCPDTTVAPVEVHQIEQGPPPQEDPASPAGGNGEYLFPAPPPDLDCGTIEERSFQVRPGDPHRFDSDGDGIGCEG